MSKITVNNVADLTQTTTAATTINANSSTLQTAFDNTLSRDGTAPNQMLASLDMNSNQIINLPSPSTVNSPLRLQDLNTFIGGGTITSIPSGGTAGQSLIKNSNANFDVSFGNPIVSFTQTGAGAVTRSITSKLQDVVSVKDFGAVGDGITVTATVSIASGTSALTATGASFTAADVGKTITVPGAGAAGAVLITTIASFTDATHVGLTANASTTLSVVSKTLFYGTDNTSAFNTATVTGFAVYVPSGTYLVSTITITKNGTRLIGAGQYQTILTSATINQAIVQVAANLANIEIADLGFDRAVTPTNNGFGVQFLGFVDTSNIRRLTVKNQYAGIVLSSTGFSQMADCSVFNSVADGVFISNTASNGNLQWSLFNNFVQACGGRGYVVITNIGPAGVTMGEWYNTQTFGNTGFGVAFAGSASCPINAIRMNGGFIGGDGNSGVYLDTFAGLHHINNVYVEAEGAGNTGPGLTTPPSNIGSGLEITANNTDVTVNNFTSINNSQDGMRTAASVLTNIEGGRFANNNLFGIRINGTVKVSIIGASIISNTSGPISGAATATNGSIIVNNQGYNPQAAHAITVGASPFTYTASPSGEDIFISGGTVQGINVGAIAAFGNTVTNVPIPLGPGQSVTVAYSSVPIMNSVPR